MTASTASRLYRVAFFVVLLVAIASLAVAVLRPFLGAIAWAIVLAVVFRGPWRAVERRLAPRRGLAAGVMCVLIALLVLLPGGVLGTVVFNQAAQAVAGLRQTLEGRQITSLADVIAMPWVAEPLEWLRERTGVTAETVGRRLTQTASAGAAFLASKSGGFVLGFVEAVVTFAMTIFLLFFLFRDGDAMTAAAQDLVPLAPAERERVAGSLAGMLQAIFRGSLLAAFAQGTSGGIGWALAGLPSPVLAGALTAICSLLPLGGAALVWLPGTLWLWSSGRAGAGIFLLLWGALVTSFAADNLLKPLLIRGAGELSTLIVFLGVFGGIAAFGPLGIFIGPIVLAVGLMVVDVLRTLAREARAPEGG